MYLKVYSKFAHHEECEWEFKFCSNSLCMHVCGRDDPRSIQARIQEFSSEGVQLSKNFDQKKKGGGEETEENGRMWSFLTSSEVWFESGFQTLLIHTGLFSGGHGTIANPSLHNNTDFIL